jgi:hypothetical protein
MKIGIVQFRDGETTRVVKGQVIFNSNSRVVIQVEDGSEYIFNISQVDWVKIGKEE